ncbi:hypothetical protein ACLIYM_25270 [Streptomyces fenghuangensis]
MGRVNFGLLIGLTRLRLAFIVAGLAWLFDLTPPPSQRITVVALVAVAVAFEWFLDEQRFAHTEPRDRHHTPA